MTGWEELPVDSMVLSLFHLQNYYHVEIQRGRANIGNYKLKTRYREAMLDKDEITVPDRLIDPEEIIQYVKSELSDVVSKGLKQTAKRETDDVVSNDTSDIESSPSINKDDDDDNITGTPKLLAVKPRTIDRSNSFHRIQ